ncbi:GNAT family N-acetyltransferase [Amycolatopsis vastitatis]|uniref:GNAT family N-acetyltransferase n=1 Tax=Amycolatopsis vastitatis TaxID=1905142 RepID=A0A229SV89_9PSEU|nr:GNAT family N-acetyltransferase [Amycolatopsis vastitatis]
MTELYIRSACSADLEPFAAAFGDHRYFTDRLTRQKNGRGVLFLAWLDYSLAGNVYLWLEEAEERPIREQLPGVALLTHLQVRDELRNRGVGQALVAAVERRLVEAGRDRVALAVLTDNHDAARLYDRLDYRDWGHGEVICYAQRRLPGGGILEEPERCHVLTKDLAKPSAPPPRTESSVVGVSRQG